MTCIWFVLSRWCVLLLAVLNLLPDCLLLQLLNPAISESCPTPFDEGRLWKGENAAELKAQLQATFQNITRVMDCVGCEKCKLWGKLQTLGEHLFQDHVCCCGPGVSHTSTPESRLTLSRMHVSRPTECAA
jgi:hypothetical protein